MVDRPILFSGPMVRALLDGRKTQTRRAVNPQPPDCARYSGVHFASDDLPSWFFNTPMGPFKVRQRFEECDRLWVRETWRHDGFDLAHDATVALQDVMGDSSVGGISYRADDDSCAPSKWWPGIHMPREASRLTLGLTEVRIERLQDIIQEDAIAEGILRGDPLPEIPESSGPIWSGGVGDLSAPFSWSRSPVAAYRDLWDHLNEARGYGWETNPWVVALTFEVRRGNIDDNARTDDV